MYHLSVVFFRILLKTLYVFPIKKSKVIFSSYEGKQFSCNPKYLFIELIKRKPNINCVYEFNNLQHVPSELAGKALLVRHNSLRYFYHMLTAKVIITNSGITAKIPIRKEQCVINTWHGGGAYKKGGKDINESVNGSDDFFINIQGKQTNYVVASCSRFCDVMHSGMAIDFGKFLKVGMPRNDIFFCNNDEIARIKNKVSLQLGLNFDDKFVLYAPTFRGSVGQDQGIHGEKLNIASLKAALRERFGGNWKFVYRGHYFSGEKTNNRKDVIDASQYPDMQELLVAADVLITDYSSSVWDFSLTDKPGFLFTPDLDMYQHERDFYTPITLWPYPVCKTNIELAKAIASYSQQNQINKNFEHHSLLGSFEEGKATQKVVGLILNMLDC